MLTKVSAWSAVLGEENHSTLKSTMCERHQHAVDDAVGIEQQPPDDRDDHRREQPGQDVEHPQDASDQRIDPRCELSSSAKARPMSRWKITLITVK